jgi:2'-5' RNA ligase
MTATKKPPGRRLFFALWPDANVRQALATRAAGVHEALRKVADDAPAAADTPDDGRPKPKGKGRPARRHTGAGRPIPDANLHLTLAFLGKVEETRIPDLLAATGQLAMPAFDLRIDRRGRWPRSGILWLAPSAPPAALNRLVKGIWGALEPLEFWSDFRDFRPHVTIARRCGLGEAGEVAPVDWPVRDFALMVSDLDHKGATYRVLRRWPLISV